MTAFIFVLFGFISYFICYVKTKDILQPLGVGVLLWFLAAGVSNITSLYDNSLQLPISFETNLAIFLAGLFFTLPIFISNKINKDYFVIQKLYFGFNYKFIFNIFITASILAFIMRFKSELLSPPLFFGNGFDLKESVPDALPILNFADIATSFLAIMSVWELKYSEYIKRSRRLLLVGFIMFSIIVSLVYKVSRGEFLVFILGVIYLLVIPRRIIIRFKYLFLICVFASLFLYVGALRISEGSRVSTQFGSGGLNMLLSQIYTYIAMNFQNLNLLINSNYEPTYIWGGLKFLLKPFFGAAYNSNSIGLTDYNTLFFNAKTFIYYFYNDLGFAGVIFYPLVIGLILQIIYNGSIKNTKYFVIIACLMKPILFMFFGNYFFGEFVIMIPYVMIVILTLNVKTYISIQNHNKK